MTNLIAKEWGEAHAAFFEAGEEGRCELCARESDLDSGLCEECWEDTKVSGIDEFSVAEAHYWFNADCHGGQSSPEYEALCLSPYSPGRMVTGPEPGEAADLYDRLVRRWRRNGGIGWEPR